MDQDVNIRKSGIIATFYRCQTYPKHASNSNAISHSKQLRHYVQLPGGKVQTVQVIRKYKKWPSVTSHRNRPMHFPEKKKKKKEIDPWQAHFSG